MERRFKKQVKIWSVFEFIQCKTVQVVKSLVDGWIGAAGGQQDESFTDPASRRRCCPECLTDHKQTHRSNWLVMILMFMCESRGGSVPARDVGSRWVPGPEWWDRPADPEHTGLSPAEPTESRTPSPSPETHTHTDHLTVCVPFILLSRSFEPS